MISKRTVNKSLAVCFFLYNHVIYKVVNFALSLLELSLSGTPLSYPIITLSPFISEPCFPVDVSEHSITFPVFPLVQD